MILQHSPPKKMKFIILCSLNLLFLPMSSQAEVRTFQDKEGRVIKGEIVKLEGDRLSIKLQDSGQIQFFERELFVGADAIFVEEWIKMNPNLVDPLAQRMAPKAPGLPLPWSMGVKVTPRKSSVKDPAGKGDDKVETYALDISLKNSSSKKIEEMGAILLVMGEDLKSGNLKVLERALLMGSLPAGAILSQQGVKKSLKYNDSSFSKTGIRYEGYLLWVTDGDNRLLKTDSSHPAFAKFLANAALLKQGDVCDQEFKPVK